MTQRLKTFLLLLVLLTVAVVGLAVWMSIGGSRVSRSPADSTAPPIPQQEVVGFFRKAAQERASAARQDCMREKLGPERYAAVTLSPQSTTTEEQFTLLPCYRQ
ncbi:MAG: hypothetical protein G01um101438_975 [Parcubacteria group bacterium Gr01-1014_38]|nr:MAG: hypothetical protein G01um101438_975 [Parcubacteria group bacterium Gr01-1014_38]